MPWTRMSMPASEPTRTENRRRPPRRPPDGAGTASSGAPVSGRLLTLTLLHGHGTITSTPTVPPPGPDAKGPRSRFARPRPGAAGVPYRRGHAGRAVGGARGPGRQPGVAGAGHRGAEPHPRASPQRPRVALGRPARPVRPGGERPDPARPRWGQGGGDRPGLLHPPPRRPLPGPARLHRASIKRRRRPAVAPALSSGQRGAPAQSPGRHGGHRPGRPPPPPRPRWPPRARRRALPPRVAAAGPHRARRGLAPGGAGPPAPADRPAGRARHPGGVGRPAPA